MHLVLDYIVVKEVIKVFCFFSAVQYKLIIYRKRWHLRGSVFIHQPVDNLPIRPLRSTRVIHFISHVREVR